MLDLSYMPDEPAVEILDPDGKAVIKTSDITVFTYVRLQIKKKSLRGYCVRTASGSIYPISPAGKIPTEGWDSGEITGSVFDKLLLELI